MFDKRHLALDTTNATREQMDTARSVADAAYEKASKHGPEAAADAYYNTYNTVLTLLIDGREIPVTLPAHLSNGRLEETLFRVALVAHEPFLVAPDNS
jgi:hypothetical protein